MPTTLLKRSLHQLIHVSRQILAPATAQEEVAEIIATSIRNNSSVGVTGLLLVHNGWSSRRLRAPTRPLC